MSQFEEAIKLIDAQNADDPETIEHKGSIHKKEQLHAELMTQWVKDLDPLATEAQLIAARANHLRRWELSRSDFPKGRRGYLKWRSKQASRHAMLLTKILEEVGYEQDIISRACEIIQKKNLKIDAQVQTHEDALCLVFLETQKEELKYKLVELANSSENEKSAEDKLTDILEKTLAKMSPQAIEKAQKYL